MDGVTDMRTTQDTGQVTITCILRTLFSPIQLIWILGITNDDFQAGTFCTVGFGTKIIFRIQGIP